MTKILMAGDAVVKRFQCESISAKEAIGDSGRNANEDLVVTFLRFRWGIGPQSGKGGSRAKRNRVNGFLEDRSPKFNRAGWQNAPVPIERTRSVRES